MSRDIAAVDYTFVRCAESKKCVCPEVSNPVCGMDGITYNNKCVAKCNDVIDLKCGESCEKCRSKYVGVML